MRDEDTGELWSPTALPIRDEAATYIARHGRGYSRFEHSRARDRARPPPVRAARRSDQDLAPDAPQHLGPRAASLGDRLRRMGARSVAERVRTVRDDRDRSRDRCDVRAQSVELGVRVARRLRRSRRTADGLDRRPAGVHRPQWNARRARRRSPAMRRSPSSVGAGLDPCGALQAPVELDRERWRRDRLLPRRGGERRRRADPDRTLPRRRPRRGAVRGRRVLGRPSSARSR